MVSNDIVLEMFLESFPQKTSFEKTSLMSSRGNEYQLPLDDVKYEFVLSSTSANDEVCNGGLYVVMSLGPNGRALINSVREELDLGPFPPDFAVHVTLAKITDQRGHAAFRQWPLVKNWPKIDDATQLNKPLEDLSTTLHEEGQGEDSSGHCRKMARTQ